jgi:Domain of unknown function (DUF4431)
VTRLVQRVFPGPPNYENTDTGDAPDVQWLVTLSTPACVNGKASSELNTEAESGIKEVQLVIEPNGLEAMRSLPRQNVRVTGTLFHAHTAQDITLVRHESAIPAGGLQHCNVGFIHEMYPRSIWLFPILEGVLVKAARRRVSQAGIVIGRRQFQLKRIANNPTIVITPPPTSSQTCAESVWIPWIGPLVGEKLSRRLLNSSKNVSIKSGIMPRAKNVTPNTIKKIAVLAMNVCHDHNPTSTSGNAFPQNRSTPHLPCKTTAGLHIHEMYPHPQHSHLSVGGSREERIWSAHSLAVPQLYSKSSPVGGLLFVKANLVQESDSVRSLEVPQPLCQFSGWRDFS